MAPRRSSPHAIGPYRIEGELGTGGMGIVYLARAPEGTEVALKVIRGESEGASRRFEREAGVRIDHPNVVRVLDAGRTDDGTWFIALERLVGETLAERLAGAVPPLGLVYDVAIQTAAALSAAHAMGVVHRDLKPSNLFCTEDGPVKVLDFGVAAVSSAETRLTATGRVVGTLDYLAPEQAEARPVDARTDLWALGAVLYEMLTGAPPFRQSSALATVVATLLFELVPLRRHRPDVPPGLEAVIHRALARQPEQRWASAEEMRGALLDARDEAPAEPSAGPSAPPPLPENERRAIAVLYARGVTDLGALSRSVVAEGGHPLALAGCRLIGVFGSGTNTGDELQRAALAGLRARASAERIAVGTGRASRVSTELSGPAVDAADRASEVEVSGIAVERQAARELPPGVELTQVTPEVFELSSGDGTLKALLEPQDDGPMLGREAELGIIRSRAEALVEDGRASLILVSGAQGIGKSTLVTEARCLLEAQGIRRLVGRGHPRAEARAFELFRPMVKAQLDEDPVALGRALEGVGTGRALEPASRILKSLSLLATPASGSAPTAQVAASDLQAAEDQIRGALLKWIEAQTASGPVALIAEDLQWCDEASLELLQAAMERCFDRPLFVIGTVRDSALRRPAKGGARTIKDILERGEMVRIDLRGLSRREAASLVERVAGRPQPEGLVRAITERAQGNPFFVRQIVLAMAGDDGDEEELPLPLTVEAAVEARLDLLDAAEKTLVRRASIYRRPFGEAELEAVGVSRADLALASLRRSDVLVAREEGLFDFRSGLLADVAYRTLTQTDRVSLHRAAAEHLAGDGAQGDEEETARHWLEGGVPDAAASAFASAALEAMRRGDAETALRTSKAALAIGVADDLIFALRIARADALRFRGRRLEQGQELDAAAAAARTPKERARALSEQSVLAARAGRPGDAVRLGREAVAQAAVTEELETRAFAAGRLGLALLAAGQLDEARTQIDDACRIAKDGGLRLRAMTSEWAAQLASVTGDLAARRAMFERAAQLHEENGDLRRSAGARCNAADVSNRAGVYAEADVSLEAAYRMCVEVGHRTMAGYALLNRAYALTMGGRARDALEMLDEANAIAEATTEIRLVLLSQAYRGRALLALGRSTEAGETALAAAEGAAARAMPSITAVALSLGARAALDQARASDAFDLSERGLARCREVGGLEEDEIEVYLTHADAARATGRGALADEVEAQAATRLDALARDISDPGLRQSFLNAVPAHRELRRRLAKAAEEG